MHNYIDRNYEYCLRSLDGANEQQNVDLKRQLQLIEQEASVLTTKNQTLEADNEKLQAENKKNQVNFISHHLLYLCTYNQWWFSLLRGCAVHCQIKTTSNYTHLDILL